MTTSPEMREPTMIEELESTLRGRLTMAKARYEQAQEAFDAAVAEGCDVDAVIPRRLRPWGLG